MYSYKSTNGQGIAYQNLPFSLNLYCETTSGYEPVDFCNDYDKYSDILYGSGELEDCDPTYEDDFKICCGINELISTDDPSNKLTNKQVDVRTNNMGIQIEDVPKDLTYTIYNMSGIKQLSGVLENNYTNIISNYNLKNGIYIMVISGEKYYSSHKFVSFR